MNASFKKFSRAALALSMGLASVALVACGDDSSDNTLSLSSSFEMVLSKTAYTYKSKDSTLVVNEPVCAVSSLGDLVWRQSDAENPDTMKFYMVGSNADLCESDGKDCDSFSFEGSSFPRGLLIPKEDVSAVARYGFRIDRKVMKNVYQYDGDCFAKSYHDRMLKGDDAFVQADYALVNFYKKFLADDSLYDEDAMKEDFNAPNCDELTMHYGDISIQLKDFHENSGKVVVTYKKNTATIEFTLRYAYNETDCRAAYNEYKDEGSDDEFDFDDYSMELTDGYIYDINDLANNFKRDNKILGKAAASDEEYGREFARSLVKAVLAGMK